MKQFKGTPGPWFSCETGRGIGPVSNDNDQSYGMIIEVAFVEFDTDESVQQANARLIAAAPELLCALEMLVLFTPRTKRNAAALHNALAAINKATGETK